MLTACSVDQVPNPGKWGLGERLKTVEAGAGGWRWSWWENLGSGCVECGGVLFGVGKREATDGGGFKPKKKKTRTKDGSGFSFFLLSES